MRLLDAIAQDRNVLHSPPDGPVARRRLPCAADFAETVRSCPLRLVLDDRLTEYCTHLAYADGTQLGACLDLVRVPAEQLWIEWMDAPRRAVLSTIPELVGPDFLPGPETLRAGVLLQSHPAGREGSLRTFWTHRPTPERPQMSPLTTFFDLDHPRSPGGLATDPFDGAPIYLALHDEPALDGLLQHFYLRLDPGWADYYRSSYPQGTDRRHLLRTLVGAVATDLPMLFAFLLMLSARQHPVQRAVVMDRLNRRRRKSGRAALLDHVEVTMPMFGEPAATRSARTAGRSPRRLHAVRGHLVRRGSTLFWRAPHLRGDPSRGMIRSRTVTLTFDSQPR